MIYYIQDPVSKAIKIGWTTGPVRNRLSALQTSHPFTLVILGTHEGEAAEERALHGRFHHLRLRGEWFEGHQDLLRHVVSTCQVAKVKQVPQATRDVQLVEANRLAKIELARLRRVKKTKEKKAEILRAQVTEGFEKARSQMATVISDGNHLTRYISRDGRSVSVKFEDGRVCRNVHSLEEAIALRDYIVAAREAGFYYQKVQDATLGGYLPDRVRIGYGLNENAYRERDPRWCFDLGVLPQYV